MQIIRTYPTGSSIFHYMATDGSTKELCNPWPVALFFDPPQQPTALGSMGTDHSMTFHGTVAGHDTRVLLDSGATLFH